MSKEKHLSPKTGNFETCNPKATGVCGYQGEGNSMGNMHINENSTPEEAAEVVSRARIKWHWDANDNGDDYENIPGSLPKGVPVASWNDEEKERYEKYIAELENDETNWESDFDQVPMVFSQKGLEEAPGVVKVSENTATAINTVKTTDSSADNSNDDKALSVIDTIEGDSTKYGDIKDRDERKNAMLEDLEKSVIKMAESGELQHFMDTMRKNGLKRYSMNNRLLAFVQIAKRIEEQTGEKPKIEDYSDPNKFNVAGFKQWESQGRKVKKGSKAIWILAPVIVQDKSAPEDKWVTDKKTGKKKPPEKLVGYRSMSVFNITDTEGDPLPTNPSINEHYFSEDVPEGTMDKLESHVKDLGFEYEEKEIPGTNVATGSGTLAYVDPKTNKVVVDSRLPAKQKALAAIHEIAHIETGHTKDLSEYQKHRGQMETEAEMSAYLVGRELGLISGKDDGSDAFSSSYIAGWASDKDGKLEHKKIQSAMNKASKAFDKIIDSLNKK